MQKHGSSQQEDSKITQPMLGPAGSIVFQQIEPQGQRLSWHDSDSWWNEVALPCPAHHLLDSDIFSGNF